LLVAPRAPFAALQKDANMQSDQFTFHLKKLIKAGYVHKDDSNYQLTIMGKEYANRMNTDERAVSRQAKISVVVIVEDEAGRILHQQRLKHPYYGYWGHISGKVRWGETLLEAGSRELAQETGLEADLKIVCFYHKLDYDQGGEQLLEDKLFCVMHGTKPRGALIADAQDRHNQWMSAVEFTALDKLFGDAKETMSLIQGERQVILENKYYYSVEDY
jgi:ADP-ribose pyrophosphatase YjhB (NUDIX family)